MFADDRNAEAPRLVALRPRRRFTVRDADGTHVLDPSRDRVAFDHVWIRQRPELWELAPPVDGQSRKHYEQAASRTRSELANLCGRVAAQLERTGTTGTRTPERASARGGSRRRPRPLRLP